MKCMKVTTLLISGIIYCVTIAQVTIASKATRHASKELVEESISKRSDSLSDLAKPYQFGYQIKDKDGNVQHRHEESDSAGVKRGSYGYVDANGVYRKVYYVADKNGFRIKEMKSNEPGFDEKVSSQAMKETSKLSSSPAGHYSSPSLTPSLLSSDSSNYKPSSVTSLTDRELNNQLVKASFNLNTSESKKDSSKAQSKNGYQSIVNKVKDVNSHNNLISHSLLPLRPPYTESYSTDGLISNPSYSRDIGSSSDTRRDFTHEPYVYYAQPSPSQSLPLVPVRSIDTTFPYKFVAPRGYTGEGHTGNSLESSHSMPIYSSLTSPSSGGKHLPPYLRALPIHTYRAPTTNTSSSNYGVSYASSPPKTVYVPVYPPILSSSSYSTETPYQVTPTPYNFESNRLRSPEPTSSTTLGYMHPLQPIRSTTPPTYTDKYHHHSRYNSPPDNAIDRPSHGHHSRHPMDMYHPQYPQNSPPYQPYSPYDGPSSSPHSGYMMKPQNSYNSPVAEDRPLQYLDGPGPGSMIGTNRMQPTVFYVTDSLHDENILKKQNTLDPLPYDDHPPQPHRTGHHDPTPHGFESPFIDVPPTAPPVPPPDSDNNQGQSTPGGGDHASQSNGPRAHLPLPPPHHHHHPHGGDHHSGYPSPPSPPVHPTNPYYNPYNPYSNTVITDPARARLASYYQAVRTASPPPPSLSSPLSVSPSTSSSPSTVNVPSVLLGIQSAQGLEVATSLSSLSDTDVNYNPSHYPTSDQLMKWKARVKSSSYRRSRGRNTSNSIVNSNDDVDDDAVITSSSDIDLKRFNDTSGKLPRWFGGLR